MKFGIFYELQLPRPWTEGGELKLYQDALTQVELADRTGYDYRHHAEVGSSNAAFVGDEVTDRFCILGEADAHIAKLRELADAGVDQFNLYLMNGDEEAQVEAYGRDVIPALGG